MCKTCGCGKKCSCPKGKCGCGKGSSMKSKTMKLKGSYKPKGRKRGR